MPFEILESIANVNYNTPRPRPIDPAVVFDLVKIRRLVDEASNLAVRAASDIASPTLTSVHGGVASAQESLSALGIPGPGHGSKLSRERKFRMREQAIQKLARAYHLDEIASSVAVMQGATSLEDVGSLVLQRNPQDPDAKYVHFFHEKIPSRQLAESTSLQPLTEIISERPNGVEVLRTRATVRQFKEDFDGAIQDLNLALSGCRFHQPPSPTEEELQKHEPYHGRRRTPYVILSETDQPSSLETQLTFHRATTYLSLACQQIERGGWTSIRWCQETQGENGVPESNGKTLDESVEATMKSQLDSRKLVKTYAKRALRDFLSFISKFEYSPNLPTKVITDFNDRLRLAERRGRHARPSDDGSPIEPYTTYSLDTLFAALPPSDLPPYPPQDIAENGSTPTELPTSYEFVTYHPLLTDALHSLLLCHCLLQTSSKELLRHAYMVARIVRITDGSPFFQSSRPSSRADWTEVIHINDNWLQLSTSWEILCDNVANEEDGNEARYKAVSAVEAMMNNQPIEDFSKKARQERLREEAILMAIEDERVYDDTSFRAAIVAHTKRLTEEYPPKANFSEQCNGHLPVISRQDRCCGHFGEMVHQDNPTSSAATVFSPEALDPDTALEEYATVCEEAMNRFQNMSKRLAFDVEENYPLCTPRALAIAEWVHEAPSVPATTRRKKRSKKDKKASDETMEQLVDNLDLGEGSSNVVKGGSEEG